MSGRHIARIDAEGRETCYQYDPAGRMTVRQHAGDDAAYFAYDENGNRTSLLDSTGETAWTYDALDRMIKDEEVE